MDVSHIVTKEYIALVSFSQLSVKSLPDAWWKTVDTSESLVLEYENNRLLVDDE